MNNLLEILNKSVNYLQKKNIKNARVTAETVLAKILNVERIMLYANFEKVLDESQLEEIRKELNIIVSGKNIDLSFENDSNKKNVKALIDKSEMYLKKNNIVEAKLITEIIFSHILKVDRMMLFTKYREIIEEEKIEKIRKYIQKVGKEKFPVQYLLNEQEFYGRSFYVNKGVLIPRQDTEIVVETALNILNKIENAKVLDIGSGSGVIGITIALENVDTKVLGIDISDIAIEISKKNKELLSAKNIKFLKSDLFEKVEYKEFDMIVSNPPYIAKNELDLMSDDTILHEPDEALYAQNEGLYFYEEISKNAINYLSNGGYLVFEIGYRQGEIIKEMLQFFGYKNVEIIKDMQQNDRVVVGQK